METASKIAEEARARSLEFYRQWLADAEAKASESKKADDYILAAIVAKLKSIIETMPNEEIADAATGEIQSKDKF